MGKENGEPIRAHTPGRMDLCLRREGLAKHAAVAGDHRHAGVIAAALNAEDELRARASVTYYGPCAQ